MTSGLPHTGAAAEQPARTSTALSLKGRKTGDTLVRRLKEVLNG